MICQDCNFRTTCQLRSNQNPIFYCEEYESLSVEEVGCEVQTIAKPTIQTRIGLCVSCDLKSHCIWSSNSVTQCEHYQ